MFPEGIGEYYGGYGTTLGLLNLGGYGFDAPPNYTLPPGSVPASGTSGTASNPWSSPYFDTQSSAASSPLSIGAQAMQAAGNLMTGGPVSSSPTASSNSSPRDWLSGYFTRGVIIVLGFIFVGVGLSMFRQSV